MQQTKKNQGFTLIELMVTIAVMAIIAMMAAPSFGDMVLSQNLNRSAQDLILTLNEARSKAALERRNIEVNLFVDEHNSLPINTPGIVNWKPKGKAILQSATSITFDITGVVSGASTDTTFQICDQSGGVKSKIISISKMGTIQQTTEGTC
ncbi:type II secretion system protein GspH [Acinetobacter sp. ANC 4470]|uniref:pilus assembly FimT family protein n=1 Tax=Acinetobacter sp. ANC 4470 TaxID=1977881 RepID=UPI000A347890|nr:prepilin-type N-terminal cleavage/methylation domain-containing protein [Acinetobacter sp. ANC 4470]OTG63925.1 type II secretion system protein GspH [Acinetobacter sp. ANC 4470]